MNALIRLENVSLNTGVSHKEISLLNNISFSVNVGEKIAIIGPSGAGKTSLLRLINRLSSPSKGEIYLENQNYREIPVIQLRQKVTLVLQESKLLGMTVAEALAYPLKLRKLPEKAIAERLEFWIEKIHLPTEWLQRTEVQLSVGQRQLVAIARALIIQPKILLLDEPTSALDGGRAKYLINVLNEVANTANMAIFMVNHQWEFVQEFGSQVIYLDRGEIISDTPSHLTNWEKLRQEIINAEAREAEEWN